MRSLGSRLLLAVLAAAYVGVGCGEGAGDVNRVQPNYYDKSLFEGTWYYKQTITEVPFEVSWVFEGIGSQIDKVRWEIQEKYLIAYRATELIPGANGGDPEKNTFTPVAAWSITSHFDIIRQYNAGTGEQNNVIVEDTSDRPWHKRKYIRVDWTKNTIANFNYLDKSIIDFAMTGAPYWIQPHEEDNPDRAEITKDYISVVGLYDAKPDYNACYGAFIDSNWGVGPGTACAPASIKIRSSFMKVDPKAPKYQPLDYPDNKELSAATDGGDDIRKKLTICTSVSGETCSAVADLPCTAEVLDTLRADPFYGAYGYTETDCQPATQDYNNKFGYFRTERIIYDRERGLHEAGRFYMANRWNIWQESYDASGQAIPYGDRTVKPIVYHLNADFPEDLYDAAFEVGKQWNEAFQRTVSVLQGKPASELPAVFEVRENSCSRENVKKYVSQTRGAKEVAQRIIGGINNLSLDNLQQLCAALESNFDFHWQKAGDLRYSFIYWTHRPSLAGPLGFGPSYTDPDTGEIINGMAYVYGSGVNQQAAYGADIVDVLAGRQTLNQVRDAEVVREAVRRSLSEARQPQPEASPAFYQELAKRLGSFHRLPEDKWLQETSPDRGKAAIERIAQTPMGRELLQNDMWTALTNPGWRPGMDLEAETAERESFTDLLSGEWAKKREEAAYRLTSGECILPTSFTDDSVIGLAMEFDPKSGADRDQVYRKLRESIFIGVMLHEVGHTIGLRHNFGGSQDPLNYFDDYWKYRELDQDPSVAIGQVQDPELAQRLDRCMEKANEWNVPAPSTLSCLRGSEMQQASIMDYGAKFNSDFQGLGKYDKAAIAFGYGQLIEVFDDEVVDALPAPAAEIAATYDYKKFPALFQGIEGIAKRKLVPYEAEQRKLTARMHELAGNLPTIISTGANTYSCTQNCGQSTLTAEVPYRFCSDELRAYFNVPQCRYFDEGPNQEESIAAMIDQTKNYYHFTAFRRGRFGWDPIRHVSNLQRRVMEMMKTYQYFYYYSQFYGPETDLFQDFAKASVRGLNYAGEVLQIPEPGDYCPSPDGVYRRARCETPVVVPEGVGHSFWLEYTDDYPHYQIESIGAFYEKLFTLVTMTDFRLQLPKVSGESRVFDVSYYRLFNEELLRLFGGLTTLNLADISGHVQHVNGQAVYRPRPLVDIETFGTGVKPAQGALLSPVLSLDLRDYALMFGMIYFNSNTDDSMEFRDFFQVAVKGSEDDFDIEGVDTTDPDQYVEFVNPSSRMIYRAAVNPRSPELSYGYRMVREGKRLVEDHWIPSKKALELAEQQLDEALTPKEREAALEAYANASARFESVEAAVSRQVELIDRARFLHVAVGLPR